MDQINRAASGLWNLFVSLFDVILLGIAAIETWTHVQLRALGIPAPIDTLILIALAIVLIFGAIRLFGGVFRVLILAVLVLLILHVVLAGPRG